jgi:hypothetical protein
MGIVIIYYGFWVNIPLANASQRLVISLTIVKEEYIIHTIVNDL